MLILGVDPGIGRIGLGLVRREGSRLIEVHHHLITTPQVPTPDRLLLVQEAFDAYLDQWQPDTVATERLLFAANKTTAIEVARALGVMLCSVGKRALPWREYTPAEIKRAVVGNGAAEKKQVQFMVTKLLLLEKTPKPDDVADALAIAICHALTSRVNLTSL